MKYLSLMLIALLILTACATQEPSKAKQLAEELKQQAETPVQEVTETPTEEAKPAEQPEAMPAEEPKPVEVQQPETKTEATEEITSPPQQRTKMYKFLDIFAKNVKSYQFDYKSNKYFVKGTRYKIILPIPVIVKYAKFGEIEKNLFYYDTVYLDRATKTAIAFCEGHESHVNSQCTDLNLFDLAYPVDYKKYDILLPEDWLFNYLNLEPNQLEENKYYLKGRASVFVKFNLDPTVELNIDPGTGLILQADQKKGSQLIARNSYDNLVSNIVRDIDVQHRSKSEIPTSEPFYR